MTPNHHQSKQIATIGKKQTLDQLPFSAGEKNGSLINRGFKIGQGDLIGLK